ncbi:hypothetical protein ALC57_15963 [Trachymyrmex cornetzi]|uniref:Actin interacting protein 3-like C-terminal domain-containing protein n=1 Tax=Trachymyrmex cornetzi TaxID=471704 RepID=A0A195DG54_9HYME|nr:hypothetical protein ALC57_15963 [Trachymyrmex cornetzi]
MCSKCSECCQGSRHSVDASPTPGSDSDASEEEWNPDGKGHRQSNDTGEDEDLFTLLFKAIRTFSDVTRNIFSEICTFCALSTRGNSSPPSEPAPIHKEPKARINHIEEFYGAEAHFRAYFWLTIIDKRPAQSPLPRGYPPPSAMLFDDDPGIMSEVETSSTGFRRGGKQRSSLPVVRTPSKTLERPLGLVFLQYRNETKRALLPNEITSIDTVKALFVRSFPKQLTMEYLDSPHVKVYIHDSNKDMFYELEDLRSHLRDIRDRSVLRLFESADGVTGMPGPMGVPGGGGGLPPHWEDQSYFSEPEFDSEYQHQHIHKSKVSAS